MSLASLGARLRFTLVELILALALLAVLAATGAALIGGLTRAWDQSRQQGHRVQELVRLDRCFRSLVGNAMPFTWRDATMQQTNAFIGNSDSVRLASQITPADAIDGGLRFSFITLNREGELIAIVSSKPFSEENEPEGLVSVLSKEVAAIRFSYCRVSSADPLIEVMEWVDVWESDRADIPLAIRMEVEWQDGRTENFLMRTAGSGRYERHGSWRNGEKLAGQR
ncbi:MAG: hypothetical protein RL095_3621 [Verrucomicrobiota bacterium]|jgi:prepilin-type N-terminal cleavage/methylation domain-containing protein